MRIALLLYGTLNTHQLINGPGSQLPSIPKILLEMRRDGDISLHVYVLTEDKNFFKWSPEDQIRHDSVHGYPLIQWVEDRYAVCQYDAGLIRSELKEIYGDSLETVNILVDRFDPEAWATSKDDYRVTGSTNRWRNTMIMTFLGKKRQVFDMANISGKDFDAYAICRPDSRLHQRGVEPKEQLRNIFQDILTAHEARVHYDRPNINFETFGRSTNWAMLKNDDLFANYSGMEAKVSLYDHIIRNFDGNFFQAYDVHAYRCEKCFHTDVIEGHLKTCPVCLQASLKEVSEWPEFKMFAHLQAQEVSMKVTPFTCTVVR